MRLVMNNDVNPETVRKLVKETRINEKAVQYLVGKGYDTKEKINSVLYFNPTELRPLMSMKNAEAFMIRLENAVKAKENITIYGDYDGDGIMGTIIMYEGLKKLGVPVKWFINNRIKEGYGMNIAGITRLMTLHPETQLIVTVDNGIKAFEGIKYAQEHGIDVIVSDHHGQSEGESLPECPVVCEKRLDEDPNGEWFCGAELARRIIVELFSRLGKKAANGVFLEELYAYAGFATITDSVPMNPANHYVAKHGLYMIAKASNMIWRVLYELVLPKKMDQDTIGYQYGPMVNAPGRILGDVDVVLEALIAGSEGDEEACKDAVRKMIEINKERQARSVTDDQIANGIIETMNMSKDPFIVIHDDRFTEGMNGLVSGHITEAYKVPSIVLSPKDSDPDLYKGSCRSVEGVNVFELLNQCRDELEYFGGHPMAAGLAVRRENIPALRAKLISLVSKIDIKHDPEVKVDLMIEPGKISRKALMDLDEIMPFGPELEKPMIGMTAKIRSVQTRK